MKSVLITGSASFLPVAEWLISHNLLGGVVLQDSLSYQQPFFSQWLVQQNVPHIIIEEKKLISVLPLFFESILPDIALVFGFSYILPSLVLKICKFGFYNIHFSLLPAYRGPSPIFWQLKNGEKETGISLHKITDEIDKGSVMVQVSSGILKKDNWGTIQYRLTQMVPAVLHEFFNLKKYEDGTAPLSLKAKQDSYYKRPEMADLRIHWHHMTAEEVQSLVQACNPVYQGATALWNNTMEVKLLQAHSTGEKSDFVEKHPGKVLTEKQESLIVVCKNGTLLEVDIIANVFGVFTGAVFFHHMNPGPEYNQPFFS